MTQTLMELRQATDWTVHKIAAEIGVMPQTIYNWEQGKKFPHARLDQFLVYAECLGVDFDDLRDSMIETYQGERVIEVVY